jgi:hypothetical protein
MPLAGSGSRKENNTFGDDLGKRLEHPEELVRSISSNLRDIKQQYQGLSVAVLCLEKQSTMAGDGQAVAAVAPEERRISLCRPEWCPWTSPAQL